MSSVYARLTTRCDVLPGSHKYFSEVPTERSTGDHEIIIALTAGWSMETRNITPCTHTQRARSRNCQCAHARTYTRAHAHTSTHTHTHTHTHDRTHTHAFTGVLLRRTVTVQSDHTQLITAGSIAGCAILVRPIRD